MSSAAPVCLQTQTCGEQDRSWEGYTQRKRWTKLLVKWELEQTGKCPQIPVTSAGAVHSHCGLGSCLFKELSSVLGRGEPLEGEIGRENSTSISSASHQSSPLACILSVETGILADKNHQNLPLSLLSFSLGLHKGRILQNEWLQKTVCKVIFFISNKARSCFPENLLLVTLQSIYPKFPS